MRLGGSVIALLLVVVGWWLYAQPALPPISPEPVPGSLAGAVASQQATANIAGETPEAMLPELVRERATVHALQPRYSIRGVVTRAGVGQPGREVVCYGQLGSEPQQTVSGRDGSSHFEGYLPRGTYSLTFTKGELVHLEQLYVDGAVVAHSLKLPW